MNRLRWILIVPAAIAAWYATFFVGILVHQTIETAACPEAEWTSGSCTNENVQKLLKGVVVAFVALSAVAVVAAAAMTAPSHRAVVAWLAFGGGAIVAVWFAILGELYGEGAAAVVSGLATAFLFGRWRSTPSHSSTRESR